MATETCKALEQKMLAKLQSLQQNYTELTEREAKLSQAKLELSKERMELQQLRKQLRQTRCSLCKIGDHNKELTDLITKNDSDPLNRISGDTNSRWRMPSVDELLNAETIAENMQINLRRKPFEIDLASVPDLADTSDNLLDPDLLLVKLNLLNSKNVI